MVICDTSGLLAAFDRADPDSATAAASLVTARPPRVISPYVVAELDHLVRRRLGHDAARSILARLTGGGYELSTIAPEELRRALEIDRVYGDFGIGVTDASLVVLAARYDTRNLLTFDERHFRKVTPIQGGSFRLLPLDAA
jgi:uncharacterized protein